jgi:Fe2+ transport system protein FeoA
MGSNIVKEISTTKVALDRAIAMKVTIVKSIRYNNYK